LLLGLRSGNGTAGRGQITAELAALPDAALPDFAGSLNKAARVLHNAQQVRETPTPRPLRFIAASDFPESCLSDSYFFPWCFLVRFRRKVPA
jgi:hypothetical protein